MARRGASGMRRADRGLRVCRVAVDGLQVLTLPPRARTHRACVACLCGLVRMRLAFNAHRRVLPCWQVALSIFWCFLTSVPGAFQEDAFEGSYWNGRSGGRRGLGVPGNVTAVRLESL